MSRTLSTFRGCLLLTRLGISLFCLVVAPIELVRTIRVRSWEPVQVALQFTVVSRLVASTLQRDRDRYPVGLVTTAYREPGGGHYVLEQNSIRDMVALVILSSLYPAIALWALLRPRTRMGG